MKLAPDVGGGTGVGAGDPSILWSVSQVCMLNSPVPGEHLGDLEN